MNNQQFRESTIEIASKFLGMDEHRHRTILKEFVGVTPSATPWCAAFVNAVVKTMGLKGTGSNLARSFLKWGVSVKDPIRGDIVVFSRGNSTVFGHVGFFVGHAVENRTGRKMIQVLGGNQSDSVNFSYYPADKVLGFRTLNEE